MKIWNRMETIHLKNTSPIPRQEWICLIIISSLQARLDQMVGAQVDLLARVLVKQVTQFIVCSFCSVVRNSFPTATIAFR